MPFEIMRVRRAGCRSRPDADLHARLALTVGPRHPRGFLRYPERRGHGFHRDPALKQRRGTLVEVWPARLHAEVPLESEHRHALVVHNNESRVLGQAVRVFKDAITLGTVKYDSDARSGLRGVDLLE